MQRSSAQPRLPPLPPQGLTVLLVSTDDVIHSCIKNQLSHPHYQISLFPTYTSALRFLKNDNIDLVLSDFSLKDMDGYEFIAQVQNLRKNIPHVVIFEAERLGHEITTAYKLGACYILWKPVSEASDEIRNLWQHVFRRRAQFESLNHQNEGFSSFVSSQQESLNRGNEFMNHGEEPSSKKRPRFVWTDERHARFVEVVKQLGKDAVPNKILLAMNEPGLTREIVGSHLQKHRENEKKKERELLERHMNNANERNRLGINNHIFAPPGVSSSSYHDMSHIHLLETSTTNSPPPPRPQMQRHHYNHQHLACQPQIQYKHHHHNFGVTPLMGNGVNNLTSFMQQPSHASYGRRMHQPDRISNDGNQALGTSFINTKPQITQNKNQASFESKESNMLLSNMLQNSGSGSSPHGTNIRGANQNQASCVSSHGTSNMLPHQLDQSSCLGSSYHGTTIGGANQSQSNQDQVSCFSSHGTTIRGANENQSNKNLGIGMQQLDQNPSSGSGIVMQPQQITHQFDQENSFNVEFDQEDSFNVDSFDVDKLLAGHPGE